MPIEVIYLARHGFRLSWESAVWKSVTGTPRDPPLSAHGVDQAVELANWFASLEQQDRPDLIYTSPLYRCLQTATPSAKSLSLPIHVEHGLAEWYLPVKRGLHPRSLPSEKLKEWFPLITNGERNGESLVYVTQKGESIDQIHERAEQVLRELLKVWDQAPETASASSSKVQEGAKSVVCFTHAATNIALGRALVGDRALDIRSGTCSVGKYRRIKGREHERGGLGAWECEKNGDCSFLKAGEERHWEFSYVEEYEEDGILEDATEEVPLPSETYKSIPLPPTGGKL